MTIYKDSKRIVALSTIGTSTVTFEDDFSTDKGWTTTDSGKYSYNSGGWIDFDAISDQSDNRISIDIGTTLSNTAWVMRWKQEVTGFAQGTQAQHLSFDVGISDREVDGATAIGIIKAHHASNSAVNYTNVSGYAVGDGTDYDSYGGTPSYPNGHVSGFTPSAKTNWVELKRTGSTSASLAFYTDDSYSASALDGSVKEVTIGSSPTGLRYVMLGSEYANQIAGNARYSGKFSELKIYDGVTSVVTETQRPTNVQDNSLFIEKDTARRYWRSGEESGSDTNTSQSTYNDDSGIDSSTGGWGARFNAGHALVGQEIRSIKVRMRCASPNTVNMTARLYGSTKATLRATSTAVSSSGLTSSYVDKTFVFPSGSRGVVQAGDHIMIVADSAVASSGGWNCQIKSGAGTNTHFTTWQGQSNAFTEQTTRELWYDPIVSGTFTPATWTMQPTYDTNFTSTSGWLTDGTDINIDTGVNAIISDNNNGSTTHQGISKDLGSDLHATKWVIDLDIYCTNITNSNSNWTHIGMSNYDASRDDDEAQNFMGINVIAEYTQSATGNGNYLGLMSNSNTTLGNFTPVGVSGDGDEVATGAQFYLRLIRDGTTTLKLERHPTSARTGSTLTTTHSCNNLSGLRYFVISHRSRTHSGRQNLKIENVRFYNGVTSIN